MFFILLIPVALETSGGLSLSMFAESHPWVSSAIGLFAIPIDSQGILMLLDKELYFENHCVKYYSSSRFCPICPFFPLSTLSIDDFMYTHSFSYQILMTQKLYIHLRLLGLDLDLTGIKNLLLCALKVAQTQCMPPNELVVNQLLFQGSLSIFLWKSESRSHPQHLLLIYFLPNI